MNAIAGVAHPNASLMKGSHVQIGCTIGPSTRVWQSASVIRRAVIGACCSIAAGAVVDGSCLGDRVIVSHCALIAPGMVIGNDVFVGPFACLCNDAWPRVDKSGFDLDALLSDGFVSARIEDGASICAHAVILPGVVIGAEAMIAAGAVVSCDVPDKHVYHRDGKITPIDPKRPPHRMREAAS